MPPTLSRTAKFSPMAKFCYKTAFPQLYLRNFPSPGEMRDVWSRLSKLLSTILFLQWLSHDRIAGWKMWDASFPKLLTHSFLIYLILVAFSTTVDLLFDAGFSDLYGSVNFLTTVVVGYFRTIRSWYAASISIVCSLQKLVKAENLRVAPIDHEIDQSILQSSRCFILTLLCMHLLSTSTI